MTDDHIQYEKRGSIGFVKFNRPDKRNAFTVDMFRRIAEVFTEESVILAAARSVPC